MLLSIPQCTEESSTTKYYPASKVSKAASDDGLELKSSHFSELSPMEKEEKIHSEKALRVDSLSTML